MNRHITISIFILVVFVSSCESSQSSGSTTRMLSLEELYQKSISDLDSSSSEIDRFHTLGAAARLSYETGNFTDARRYAEELLLLSERYQSDWNFGNATHYGNVVLGRLELRDGNVDRAKFHLIKAGNTSGSPQLNSFGPNMALAMELLEKNEKGVVLEYLGLCQNFWKTGNDQLAFWKFQITEGRIPDFGANLFY